MEETSALKIEDLEEGRCYLFELKNEEVFNARFRSKFGNCLEVYKGKEGRTCVTFINIESLVNISPDNPA